MKNWMLWVLFVFVIWAVVMFGVKVREGFQETSGCPCDRATMPKLIPTIDTRPRCPIIDGQERDSTLSSSNNDTYVCPSGEWGPNRECAAGQPTEIADFDDPKFKCSACDTKSYIFTNVDSTALSSTTPNQFSYTCKSGFYPTIGSNMITCDKPTGRWMDGTATITGSLCSEERWGQPLVLRYNVKQDADKSGSRTIVIPFYVSYGTTIDAQLKNEIVAAVDWGYTNGTDPVIQYYTLDSIRDTNFEKTFETQPIKRRLPAGPQTVKVYLKNINASPSTVQFGAYSSAQTGGPVRDSLFEGIQNFGSIPFTSLSRAMASAESIKYIPDTLPPTVTNMTRMFYIYGGTINDVFKNIAKWDISNVTNMPQFMSNFNDTKINDAIVIGWANLAKQGKNLPKNVTGFQPLNNISTSQSAIDAKTLLMTGYGWTA